MKKNGKTAPLDLHILIEKEDRLYSALCLELDVASQGRTIAEAKKNIVEAIELFLESVYAAGNEKEFIPRLAPVEEWMKYFQAMTRRVNENFYQKPKAFCPKDTGFDDPAIWINRVGMVGGARVKRLRKANLKKYV